MSTSENPQPAQLAQLLEDARADGAAQARVYRGRSVSELIPRIQAELGAEAIVTGRRSGLEGGVAGFFQRPFVELEVQPGTPRIDVRDGEEARPPVFTTSAGVPLAPEGPAPAPAIGEAGLAASEQHARENGFADALAAADAAPLVASGQWAHEQLEDLSATDLSLPALDQAPAARDHTRAELALARELQASGFEEQFATLMVEAAVAHVLPFAPRMGLRQATRLALERALPQTPPLRARGAAIVFVGPGGAGKTSCANALASRYRRARATSVADVSVLAPERGPLTLAVSPQLEQAVDARSKTATGALAVALAQGVAVVDTPAMSPSDDGAIATLARVIGAFGAAHVVVALPATLSAAAASRLLDALAPLRPNAVAITHADESEQLGVAVQAACARGLAPEYLLQRSRGERALSQLTREQLLEQLLPNTRQPAAPGSDGGRK